MFNLLLIILTAKYFQSSEIPIKSMVSVNRGKIQSKIINPIINPRGTT